MSNRNIILAAAGSAGGGGEYIEDVFSTYLWTGTDLTQTITNGIDLDGEGGLVWMKRRDNVGDHGLFDTERGEFRLKSNSTDGQAANNQITTFNNNGFTMVGGNDYNSLFGGVGQKTVGWTFRKAPKFFDIVTYTGTGANRTVAHNLGSVPGCIIVKRTDTSGDWQVYHRANTANPETDYLVLNTTAATADSNTRWNDTLPTDAVFSLGTEATVNASGGTYVAYLWAHDAGGFGDDGQQNVISCGSFTTDGSGNATVTLGYEPQLGIAKASSGTSTWVIIDNMRGMTTKGVANAQLFPNTSAAEASGGGYFNPTATGFDFVGGGASVTWIYIAIRRGPMKTPESGTEVFEVDTRDTTPAYDTTFPVDMALQRDVSSIEGMTWNSRMQGTNRMLSSSTGAETSSAANTWDFMNGWYTSGTTSATQYSWMFRRAPGFFDVVNYPEPSPTATINHNLGVAPELIIMKSRNGTGNWYVWSSLFANPLHAVFLNLNIAADAYLGNNPSPTSTQFTAENIYISGTGGVIAYLFASLAGISDIGTYTGNGTSVSVTTGFQPRFILVKRTDSTGNWIFGDSVRGLVAGDDPFLLLNTTAAQVTNQDWVDVSATGFTINETAANANVNTGTYIYLAIS